VAEKAKVATALQSVLLTLFMLFTGFLVPKNSIPQGWIWMYYLSVFRYPVSFLCNSELRDETFECPGNNGAAQLAVYNTSDPAQAAFCGLSDNVNSPLCYRYLCPITSGNQMLAEFGMQNDDLGLFFGIIVIMMAGYRLLTYLALRYIQHIKR